MSEVLIAEATSAKPIHLVTPEGLEAALAAAGPMAGEFAVASRFEAKAGQVLALADRVLMGGADFRALPARLAPGDYRLAEPAVGAALSWALGSYRFDRYKEKKGEAQPRLVVADGAERAEALAVAHACALARDMVNTPANDMGPLQIETIAREIAGQYGARIEVVAGDALLDANYPAVHAVGRAAVAGRAPRFVEIRWGEAGPLIAVVGKGVVFDTGGLDLKPSGAMRNMKKDMGGAAHALALGRLVMQARLPVRLAVLIPVVENAVAGDAMRPGDVLQTRKGMTIEVGNTDAEGRLILADALTRAAELEPDLTIDLATLTGAARAALGPQVIPFYTDDDALAADLAEASRRTDDPLWRMPLWAGYEDALDSDVADIANDPASWAQAGSVTAALFLRRFAPKGAWLHFDIFAWNPRARPGYPAGGEAQAIRALYALLGSRFG
jgi:leucyl aminopeptidase